MKRCMFVDDSPVIRKVARRILSSPDMVVVEASNGAEALDRCEADMPDVVVVDSVLPDMEAVELIKKIRQMDTDAPPRILVCLAEVDIRAIMRAKRAGAQGYLLKPFNRPQLLQRFKELEIAA